MKLFKKNPPLTHEAKILKELRKLGEFGATSKQLNRICFRYGARLHEMRRDGHNIESFRIYYPDGRFTGLWRYVLHNDDGIDL